MIRAMYGAVAMLARLHGCLFLLVCLLCTSHAHAYAWMIRHGYSQCVQCHVDPSGAGALTPYGRAMGEIVLRTRYPFDKPDDPGMSLKLAADDHPLARLGGDLRVMSLHSKLDRVKLRHELIWMQLDLDAAIEEGPVIASGSLGYAPQGALGAALTRGTNDNLVSRQHWAGAWLDGGHSLFLRAGRMNVPFGIRSIEHTLWARAYTRSDSNDQQQYGVALAYLRDNLRAEALLIAGNFQLRPDDFRERGYSAYGEWLPLPALGFGLSSRITHVELDTRLLKPEWRHAHGVFSRWASPWQPLVVLTEWDYVFESPRYLPRTKGIVGYLQADVEPTQGLHFMATGEANDVGPLGPPMSYSGWLSYAWFFAPHADLRLDNVYQSIASGSSRTNVLSFLIQVHAYL